VSTELINVQPVEAHHHAEKLFGGLSRLESAFVDHYLADPRGNASEAAKKAGYKSDNPEALWATASRLLRRVRVRNEIARRLGTSVASSTEVLEILSRHARSDLTDLLDNNGDFDLKRAKRLRILKKLKVKTRFEKDSEGNLNPVTEQEFEIHDPQAAADKLGKFHGLWLDRVETNLSESAGEKLAEQFFNLLQQAAQRRAEESIEVKEVSELPPVTPTVTDT
jgi:hypothetical protein